jgi:hypothetical protein
MTPLGTTNSLTMHFLGRQRQYDRVLVIHPKDGVLECHCVSFFVVTEWIVIVVMSSS